MENNIRGNKQTYIVMYEDENIKYIINRSICFNNILSPNYIAVLKEIASDKLVSKFEFMNDEITKLNLGESSNHFKVLEVHPEWQNYGHQDQKEINERKTDLAMQYDAVVRQSEIPADIAKTIDINIVNYYRDSIRKWFNTISQLIHKCNKNEQEEYLKLSNEYEKLYKDLERMRSDYKFTERNIQEKIARKDAFLNYKIITPSLHDDMLTKCFKYINYTLDYLMQYGDSEKIIEIHDMVNNYIKEHMYEITNS